jgi:hypothetical protein
MVPVSDIWATSHPSATTRDIENTNQIQQNKTIQNKALVSKFFLAHASFVLGFVCLFVSVYRIMVKLKCHMLHLG